MPTKVNKAAERRITFDELRPKAERISDDKPVHIVKFMGILHDVASVQVGRFAPGTKQADG